MRETTPRLSSLPPGSVAAACTADYACTTALLGSLSFRRSPCVRENCRACMSGEQHPSYVLYGRQKGRRVAVYVPEELVPEVQRGLDNGRALQELLQQAEIGR